MNCLHVCECSGQNSILDQTLQERNEKDDHINKKEDKNKNMSDNKSREDIKAARQAKKLAKQKVKSNDSTVLKDKQNPEVTKQEVEVTKQVAGSTNNNAETIKHVTELKGAGSSPKSIDEVDKVVVKIESVTVDSDKDKEQIKAERAAKKAAKQAKKKGAGEGEATKDVNNISKRDDSHSSKPINEDMTVKDVVETLRDIATVAKDIKDVTEKVSAIDLSGKKVNIIIKFIHFERNSVYLLCFHC